MWLKRTAFAFVAMLALSAVVANSAMATATESNGFWYKGSTKLTSAEPATCKLDPETSFVLTSTVGTKSTPVKITADVVECTEATITNSGSKAKVKFRLTIKEVQILEPAGCTIPGGEFETEEISGQIYMEGSKALLRLAPTASETFAEIEIEGCAITGAYPLRGTMFGEALNATNVLAAEQTFSYRPPVQAAAGGTLTFGGHAAAVEGVVSITPVAGGQIKVNET